MRPSARLLVPSAACAFLVSCFARQPVPECQVASSAPQYGIPNFAAVFTRTQGTCPTVLTADEVGVQRYKRPDSDAVTVAIRAGNMGQVVTGERFLADTDAENDCTGFEHDETCEMCLPQGGPDDNVCTAVADPTPRTLVADGGTGPNALAPFELKPQADGVCGIESAGVASLTVAPDTVELVDGGMASFGGFTEQYTWKTFEVLNTARVPGTLFRATLDYTLDGCTDGYEVVGLWPRTSCSDDADCDPVARPDAGRVIGSGINPEFKPRCDTTAGLCVLGEGLSFTDFLGE